MPTRIREHLFSYPVLLALSALSRLAVTGIFYPNIASGYDYGVDVAGGEDSA